MQVRKIMTKNPAVCTPDSTVEEVARMMETYDCGCIPVVENQKLMIPVGTITDRDIAIRAFASGRNARDLKASDIMTSDIVTVTPETEVQECLKVMENRQIRRILVTDNTGRVTGIVAQADLAENAAGQTSHFLREVSESDNEHERGSRQNRSFNSFETENRVRHTDNQSHRLNQTHDTHQEHEHHERNHKKHRKHRREKESFFSGTMLWTLLGSIGIGAGIKYYMDANESGKRVNRHRQFTGTQIKTHPVEAPDLETHKVDMKINETSEGFTGRTGATIGTSGTTGTTGTTGLTDTTAFENRGKVTGTVDTFDRTDINKDDDLKPITEVGKTASNT